VSGDILGELQPCIVSECLSLADGRFLSSLFTVLVPNYFILVVVDVAGIVYRASIS